MSAGCMLRQSSGLRIGILVCDDLAWAFKRTRQPWRNRWPENFSTPANN